MNLASMELQKKGTRVHYRTRLADEDGNPHFELECFGPGALVRKVLADSDFDIRIRPHASQQDLQKDLREIWPSEHADLAASASDPFAKQKARMAVQPTMSNSVVLRLVRTQGKGTVFAVTVPRVALPAGFNFFIVMPPACNAFAMVVPLVGDADVFLTLNSARAPAVALSRRGGTAIDAISFGATFCFPPFVPFVRINAFTATVFTANTFTFSFP